MSATTYVVTFERTLSEEDVRWLGENEREPMELSDVTGICALLSVSATLRDEAGFVRGTVDDRGDYRLQ